MPKMKKFNEFVEEQKEKENERILEEGRIRGHNVFRANAETKKICKENEKKKPDIWPNDYEAHIDKLMGMK